MPTDEKGTQIQSTQDIVDGDLWYTVHNMLTTPITKTKTGTKIKAWLKTYFDALYPPGVNVLTNGGFRVAQRGVGPFTSVSTFVNNDDSYLLDGCVFLANGSDTCDVSRVYDAEFKSDYKIRLDVETANRRFGILLPVGYKDSLNIIKNGRASLQFKIKRTGTSVSNIRAYLLSWNGTADVITSDPISAWGSAGSDPTFVANWTAENVAANIPITTSTVLQQIENIVVDTASVANLGVLIIVDDTDAVVGDFIDIGDIKLEAGSTCTAWVNKPAAQEEADCQRLCTVFQGEAVTWAVFGMGMCISTTACYVAVHFPVEMRVVPTLSYDALANFRVWVDAVTATPTVMANTYGTKKTGLLAITVASGLAAGKAVMLSINNTTNAILVFSAEL